MNKKLTKEEFLEKLKTDNEFNKKYGKKDITEGKQVLPPCHYGFQVYTRKLSLDERAILANHQSIFISPITVESWDRDNIPTRAISLMWNQRSCDFPLGIPYNIASYAILLEMLGKMVNMVPEELIGNLGDCHVYSNQVEGVNEQLTREPFKLPTLKHMKTDAFYKSLGDDLKLLGHLDITDFQLENYQSHSTIKFPLSN